MASPKKNTSRSVSSSESIDYSLQSPLDTRWNQVLLRYADVWSQAIQQDWFRAFIYPSSDSHFLREIDIAADEPEISGLIAKANGGTPPAPHDLLIALGRRMANENEPNDPEAWAAIDAGQFICVTHLGLADRRMGWEQRSLLLAAASMTVLAAHPDGRRMTYVPDGEPLNPQSAGTSKFHLLASYLISIAAAECYADDGPKQDPKILIARFCEDHEIAWQTMETMAAIILEKPADWCRGPLETIEIARVATEILTESYRRTTVPEATPIVRQAPPRKTRPAA